MLSRNGDYMTDDELIDLANLFAANKIQDIMDHVDGKGLTSDEKILVSLLSVNILKGLVVLAAEDAEAPKIIQDRANSLTEAFLEKTREELEYANAMGEITQPPGEA